MTMTIVPAHGGSYTRVQALRERAASGIRHGEPFRNNGGSFQGESGHMRPGAMIHTGRMPQDARDELRESQAVRYVITSYATPIAWLDEHGWHVPAVRYSVTTSRHQSQAHAIIRATGFGYAED